MAAHLMKGETFEEACKLVRGKPRFEYPVIVEIKADEIRCRVYRAFDGSIQFESYAEKPLHNLDGFAADFDQVMRYFNQDELDVGVLVNGNFNDSYRWTRSSKGFPKEKLDKKTGKVSPALYPDQVNFILFDLPGRPTPYTERRLHCRSIAGYAHDETGLRMDTPHSVWAMDAEGVLAIYQGYREQGYEGAMAKLPDHLYERRRSFSWMKVKPSMDFDGVLVQINEAVSEDGKPLGRAGSLTIHMEDGSTAAVSGIPHKLGMLIFNNPECYIGQWVEAKCMERDRLGGYRHPVFNRFREPKA